MEKFFGTFEVAKMCYVSPGSVIRWIHEGKLAAAKTAGGHHRIKRDDLIQFLEGLKLPVPEALKEEKLSSPAGKLKVLIVDDEAPVRQMLSSFFKKYFPELEVDEACDGFQAGWKARETHPDLVMLDLMLPGVDGFQICRLIRNLPALQTTRIIAITALTDAASREKILSLGANDFLKKPFDTKLLKEKISGQLAVLSSIGDPREAA